MNHSTKSKVKTATFTNRKKTVVRRNPNLSTRNPETKGPVNDPRKKEEVHNPKIEDKNVLFLIGPIADAFLDIFSLCHYDKLWLLW